MVLAGEIYVLSDYVPKKVWRQYNIIKLLFFFVYAGTLFDAQIQLKINSQVVSFSDAVWWSTSD